MKLEQAPADLRPHLIPAPRAGLNYHCLACGRVEPPDRLHYTCPGCGGLLLLEDDRAGDFLGSRSGEFWRRLFDCRRLLNHQPLRGIFTFHEFLAPLIPLEDVVYLGEGHTPVVAAPPHLAAALGRPLFIKHDGQNPSASFKDRGMAAALSYLKYLIRTRGLKDVLAVCASTGDTSAAAALYAAALGPAVKSAVLLPRGKVTLPQLSQPLGAGARVLELPGVFDDCMKVVEHLTEHYEVALLNSKNPWRVLGQESYAFEVAQAFDYEIGDLVLLAPVGNAGNLTAILSGLLKLHRYGVIDRLPRVGAVQSAHADPVFRYFSQTGPEPVYRPVTVKPSVAQAAMIGDPVSFPRVVRLAAEYRRLAGPDRFFVVQVEESGIMENMIRANRAGLTVCTQGGEGLAGLAEAVKLGLIRPEERVVVDSTAHALKFAEFQAAYFEGRLAEGYGIRTDPTLVNRPLA
ncbi:MAG: threonine synthase, partial [Candidatus Adiutrix sp.]|nr:threonine synthase [Candidatus Adiutrix sp.]